MVENPEDYLNNQLDRDPILDRGEINKRPYLFISYSRRDDPEFVKKLHDDLEAKGYQVWLDKADMESRGRPFLEEIYEPIVQKVDKMLLVLGPKARDSEYVRAEWEKAREYCKVIIPVVLKGDFSSVPEDIPILSKLDAIDYKEGRTYEEIFAEIERKVASEEIPIVEPIGLPNLPKYHISRFDKTTEIEKALFSDLTSPRHTSSQDRVTAIWGTSGSGKTTLANEFARDCFTRRFFSDGVFWLKKANKGDEYTQEDLQNDVEKLLQEVKGDYSFKTHSLEHGISELQKFLSKKRCLLIIDDVWKEEDIVPFIDAIQNSESHILFTTRLSDLAAGVGANVLPEVKGMRKDQSRKLLLSWSLHPKNQPDPPELERILGHCSRLPLALSMIGGMINGHPERWSEVLEKLDQYELDNIDFKLRGYYHKSLLKAISISLETLPPDLMHEHYKDWYKDLALFPKGAILSEAALSVLWQTETSEVNNFLEYLTDRSLATKDEYGIFLLDIQSDFAKSFFRDEESWVDLHKRLVDGYEKVCDSNWESCPDDGFFFQHIIAVMERAGRLETARDLILSKFFLETKHKLGLHFGDSSYIADVVWVMHLSDEMRSNFMDGQVEREILEMSLKEAQDGNHYNLPLAILLKKIWRPLMRYPSNTEAFLASLANDLEKYKDVPEIKKLITDINTSTEALSPAHPDLFWTLHSESNEPLNTINLSPLDKDLFVSASDHRLYGSNIHEQYTNSRVEDLMVKIGELPATHKFINAVLATNYNTFAIIKELKNGQYYLGRAVPDVNFMSYILNLGETEFYKMRLNDQESHLGLCSKNGKITILDLSNATGYEYRLGEELRDISLSPDLMHAAFITENGELGFWESNKAKVQKLHLQDSFETLGFGNWDPQLVDFSPSLNTIVFTANDNVVCAMVADKQISRVLGSLSSKITQLLYFETILGRFVATATESGNMSIWNILTGEKCWEANANAEITGMRYDQQHSALYVIAKDGSLSQWRLFQEELVKHINNIDKSHNSNLKRS